MNIHNFRIVFNEFDCIEAYFVEPEAALHIELLIEERLGHLFDAGFFIARQIKDAAGDVGFYLEMR